MAAPADALERPRDVAGGAHQHHLVHRADVDPQLQRRGGDDDAQMATAKPILDRDPFLARQRGVVRRDVLLREDVAQLVGEPLRRATSVGEDERRTPGAHTFAHCLGDGALHALRVRHHLASKRALHRELGVAWRAPRDDTRHALGAAEPARDRVQRRNRRRQSDAHRIDTCGGGEPLQREREVHAALAARHGVHLVHDNPAHRAKVLAHRRRGEEDRERFRRGHEDVRRMRHHPSAFGRCAVPSARRDADWRRILLVTYATAPPEARPDLGQRTLEIALDVGAKCPQRRDIHGLNADRERARLVRSHQLGDDG